MVIDCRAPNAEDVLRSIREKRVGAACADGRSGWPNPYHEPANDLAMLSIAFDDAITKALQDVILER
jgi:hypothetical protein